MCYSRGDFETLNRDRNLRIELLGKATKANCRLRMQNEYNVQPVAHVGHGSLTALPLFLIDIADLLEE